MKFKAVAPLIAILLGYAASAHAVSLTLQGDGAGLENSSAQALYASDSGGTPVVVTFIGRPAPGGGTFSELGVPSMMPDGRMLFGAESTDQNKKAHWAIYYGYPDLPPLRRVQVAVTLKPNDSCDPLLSGDPYPVADANGRIAFMSQMPDKSDALVLYDGGKTLCLARSGSRTNEGDTVAVLSFGSPEIGANGEVVFDAWLNGKDPKLPNSHRQAVLMASVVGGIRELAVEGERGPNNTEYRRPFGLPTALATPLGTMAAFTSKTPSGAALFLYKSGSMIRLLPTGVESALGPVTYLSPGRPGLMANGTTAVLAGCARIPAIFRLRRQLLDLSIQRGQLTPFGTELESLGDPVLTGSGAMLLGATDTDNAEKLYELDMSGEFFEVGGPDSIFRIAYPSHHHTIFTGTLTANQHGDFGYLGGL
jgi:hypothetical protein